MVVEASLPTLSIIVGAALVDSINPCAIGTLILLMSLLSVYHSRAKLLKTGLIYISAIFLTYLVAGLGLLYFIQAVPLYVAEYISIVVGTLVIIAGLIEIKDFFWYGQGISLAIPPERAKQIETYSQNLTTWGVAFLGAFVAAVELPCTGAPYLAIILILSQNFDFTAFLLLVLYNFVFVLPLLVILILGYQGMKLQDIKAWKQKWRGHMRMFTGALLIFLGWLLILIANGTINFA